ncbi:MAG: O-antigen ligase family protein, partial [Chloroflexota bacterium]
LVTQSRGALLGVIFGSLIIIGLRLWDRRPSKQSLQVWIGVSVIVLLVAGFAISRYSQGGGRAIGDSARLDMWRSSVEINRDNPLLGVGPGQFGRAYRDYWSRYGALQKHASAHNAYLNIAAESGWIGIGTSMWIAGAFGFFFLRHRRDIDGHARTRVDAAFGALIAVLVHSLFDVFNNPPMLLLMAVLAAYVIGKLSVMSNRTAGVMVRRAYAASLLVIVMVYGVGLLLSDRAQRSYQLSLFRQDISLARQAAQQDPYLNLYKLHIANLLGRAVFADDGNIDRDMLTQAIEAYETALALEPTWDIGWLNLAALEEQRGDFELAYDHAQRANLISYENPAAFHEARYAEILGEGTESQQIELLIQAIQDSRGVGVGILPLASWWSQTDTRMEAVLAYADSRPLNESYLIYDTFTPLNARSLIPENPETAEDWMVAGYASEDDRQQYDAFARAIAISPRQGNAYVQRGRAALSLGLPVASVENDVNTGTLFGSWRGDGATLLSEIQNDTAIRREYLIQAVPVIHLPQYFSAVVYNGRISAFDPLPTVTYPLLSDDQFAPWYALADMMIEANEFQRAANVYRMILRADWEQDRARTALDALIR